MVPRRDRESEVKPLIGLKDVRFSWVLLITLVNLGTYVAFFGPLAVLLPMQTEVIQPERKEWALAVVTGIGAAVSMFANPLFGALSDRTLSRRGRRVPWITGGSVVGAFGLTVLASAESLLMMIIGWGLVQLAVNASLAAITATLPDRVPETQRAWVGGWISLGQTLGVLVGAGLAISFGGYQAGYLACAVFLIISAVPYLLRSDDLPISDKTPFELISFVKSFWVSPKDHPDFAWAWIVRFLVNLGNAIATLYLFFFLKDAVGVEDADNGVFIVIAVYSVAVAIAAVGFGRASDRSNNRKSYVVASGVVLFIAGASLAFWQTWTGVLVAAVILGIGFGIFLAVDLAIISLVLPDEDGFAKDMGVINIANASPQVFAPIIAAPIVTAAGGYLTLYLVSGIVSLIGAAAVMKIKSVT